MWPTSPFLFPIQGSLNQTYERESQRPFLLSLASCFKKNTTVRTGQSHWSMEPDSTQPAPARGDVVFASSESCIMTGKPFSVRRHPGCGDQKTFVRSRIFHSETTLRQRETVREPDIDVNVSTRWSSGSSSGIFTFLPRIAMSNIFAGS